VDACLGDTDGLLFHRLVDGHLQAQDQDDETSTGANNEELKITMQMR